MRSVGELAFSRRGVAHDASPPKAQAVPATPEQQLTRLQRQAGNRAVTAFVKALAIQRAKEGDGPSHDVGVIQQQLNAVGASPRLAVTGRFDARTALAAKAFQRQLIKEKFAGVVENGVVEGTTHTQLKARAPSVKVSGRDTVVVGPGNTQVVAVPALGTHQTLQIKSKGVAVKELQQRLNNSPTMADAARKARATAKDKLSVDGAFGPKTDAALKQFQSDAKLPSTGIADPGTWAKLETAGGATQGHVEFEWREEVEGVRNVGGRANYDWKLSKTALTITVNINFQQKSKNVSGRINQWLEDIRQIWSTFKAVNQNDPKKKSVNINFEAKKGTSGPTVVVRRSDPSLAKPEDSRSDAANWYTIDTRRGLAPHEYGHLIGLADEYNREEGQYVAVTGEEPAVGGTEGDPAVAKTLASSIKAQMPLNDAVTPPPQLNKNGVDVRWGTNLAKVVTDALGSAQGGYSRLVRQEYEAANGTGLPGDIMAAFTAQGVTGFHGNKSAAITPFLYSNRGLMGRMETVPAKGGGGKDAHEHPIEARHVQPFVTLLSKEWALQTGNDDVWKPERR